MLRYDQLAKEQRGLEERVRRRTGSLVRTFDRVLEVLGSLGYVDGFALTPQGETLRQVYAETDLVVVEAMHRGCGAVDPAELAACVSSLVYETRGADGPPGTRPSRRPRTSRPPSAPWASSRRRSTPTSRPAG